MLKTHFFLRNAESATDSMQKFVIYCQLEIEGQPRDVGFSTKIKIPKQYWKQGYISDQYHLADSHNRQLQQIERAFADIFDMLPILYPSEPITYKKLRQLYDPVTNKPTEKKTPTLIEVLDKLVAEKINIEKVSIGTQKNYQTRKNNLIDFLHQKNSLKILISEVKFQHLKAFREWLLIQKNEYGTPKFGNDHTNKHITFVKQALEYAVNEEYIPSMPIGKLNLKYSKPKPPKYITKIFRDKIMQCQHPSVSKAKDVAIFLMWTGFSYIDYQNLKSEDLIGGCFKKERNKSGIFSFPYLFPEAKAIIEKYGGIEKLPRPHLSDINKLLRHMGDLCGVNELTVGFHLSTSVFRETFASMMENEYMLAPRIVKFMMGHTTERQMDNYSSIMPSRIMHELKVSPMEIEETLSKVS